jgi:hypothetical protein
VLVDQGGDLARSKPETTHGEDCQFDPTSNQLRCPKRGGEVSYRVLRELFEELDEISKGE